MSDSALLARFDDGTPLGAHVRVTALFDAIREARIEGVTNLHPAYRSLLVVYDARLWRASRLVERLRATQEGTGQIAAISRLVLLPVCFAPRFAPDLTQVSATARLEPETAIRLFTSAVYHVAFLGFAPGFPYLLGLPPALATPRHARPRTQVPAGSVAIAGAQAGVYPAGTPGGWQIVGRTPLRLFDLEREPMSLLNTGDEVHFVSIGTAEYEELSQW